MRVVHVNLRYPPALGGAELHVQKIARAQARKGHEIHVLTTKLDSEVPRVLDLELPDRERDDGVHVHRLRSRVLVPGVWGYGVTVPALSEQIEEIAPDVVHAHGYGYHGTDLLARRRRRSRWIFVLTSHGSFSGRGLLQPLKTAYDATRGRRTLLLADLVLTVNPLDAEALRRLGCGRVEMVPNGVDLDWFGRRPRREEARTRLGLSGAVLLGVCRLAPHKGHDLTIRALALVREKFPEVTLLLVGPDGGAERAWRALVLSLGCAERVRFLGAVPDETLRTAYAAADLFLHPARAEGFGIVLLEAMASGLPVVTTSAGGIPFAVGDAAERAAPEVGPLAEAILRLLGDPARRAEFSRRGLERAALFDWNASANRLLELYEVILRARG